jgi:hypothetical protein
MIYCVKCNAPKRPVSIGKVGHMDDPGSKESDDGGELSSGESTSYDSDSSDDGTPPNVISDPSDDGTPPNVIYVINLNIKKKSENFDMRYHESVDTEFTKSQTVEKVKDIIGGWDEQLINEMKFDIDPDTKHKFSGDDDITQKLTKLQTVILQDNTYNYSIKVTSLGKGGKYTAVTAKRNLL